MIKKIALVILVLLILIPGTFIFTRYLNYRKDKSPEKTFLMPRIETAVVELTGISSEKVDIVARLKIENPLPFTLTADSLNYRISMDSQKIIYATYPHSVTLKANDSSWISLPVSVRREDINAISSRADQQNRDSVMYVIDAAFYTHLPFKKDFKLTKKKLLPAIHILALKIDRIEIDSLRSSGAWLSVHMIFTNRNVFPINFADLNYILSIQDHQWATGVKPGEVHLAAKSSTDVPIPMQLDLKQLGKAAFDLLTKGDNLDYTFRINFKLMTKDETVKINRVVIESSGKLKPLLKAFKKKDKE